MRLFTTAFITVLCLRQPGNAWFGIKTPSVEPPRYNLVPENTYNKGKGELNIIESKAATETFLDRMLGTNCYSQAVKELEHDCRKMEQDVKTRLALRLANCQRATQGESTFPCSDTEPLKVCMERLPDRVYELFVEFLTHADSMCLFIEHREFDKYTESMLNRLSEGAGYAKEQLAVIGQSTASLSNSAFKIKENTEDTLVRLHEQRTLQFKSLDELRRHSSESVALYSDLTSRQQAAIDLSRSSLTTQQELRDSQNELLASLAAGRDRVEQALADAARQSQALAMAQEAAVAAQHNLGHQLEALADGSKGLRTAVDAVAMYQQRSDAALMRLLGRSYSLEDAAFYGAGTLLGLATGITTRTQKARLPVLGLLAATLVAERAAVDKMYMWLEVNPEGDIVAMLPVPKWIGTLLAIQDPMELNIKWAIRRTCFALALSCVLWCALSYKDYERHNNRMLRVMEEETRQLPDKLQLKLQEQLNNHRVQMRCEFLELLEANPATTKRRPVAEAALVPFTDGNQPQPQMLIDHQQANPTPAPRTQPPTTAAMHGLSSGVTSTAPTQQNTATDTQGKTTRGKRNSKSVVKAAVIQEQPETSRERRSLRSNKDAEVTEMSGETTSKRTGKRTRSEATEQAGLESKRQRNGPAKKK